MAKKKPAAIANKALPFETGELRRMLTAFLDSPIENGSSGTPKRLGSYRWGVYAFYDYDREPIYVGQTKEQLGTRIRRHLTNQRTDAVAMSVLDPFEVFEIEVWPLGQFQEVNSKHVNFAKASSHLNALEYQLFEKLRGESKFNAILNEKDPPAPAAPVDIPSSIRARVVSDKVLEIREHADVRIARRALIVSRLGQVISEREVKFGLRRVLVTQAKRLEWLATTRFESLGGEAKVEIGSENEDETDTEN